MFRLGDFYETFGEDAERAAPILGITLTSRELGKGQRFPMAGVPYHAYQLYVGKLLRAGQRVALCDQVEEAGKGRGLVRREVVRVLTPGMVVEDAYLEGGRSNYAVAVCLRAHHNGLAALDCSTGELAVIRTEPGLDAVRDELARLRPSEVVVAEVDRQQLEPVCKGGPVSWVDPADFDARAAVDRLRRLLGVETLAAFGCDEWPEALAAANAILLQAERARLTLDGGLLRLHAEHPQAFMHLDPATRRSLGLAEGLGRDESLTELLERPAGTPMGSRCLRRWIDHPLRDRALLEHRLDMVAVLAADLDGRAGLRSVLQGLHDIERLVSRAGQGAANPRDLEVLAKTLRGLPAVRAAAARWAELAFAEPSDDVAQLQRQIDTALVDDPPGSLREGGAFRPGFDQELDAIREGSRAAREWIGTLEAAERERTGIRSLRVGFNQVFGYFLEVSHANRQLIPAEYVRKQTLVNGERYITPELKEKETLVLNARSAMAAREQVLFKQLCERVSRSAAELLSIAQMLGELDALAALAELAASEGWVRPRLMDRPGIEIVRGRHPLVERALGPGRFVPNDVRLHPETAQIVLLSGPNMAGKSTYLRQVALIVLLAQVGSFVPAERASIGLCDRIFTRVGAHDELSRGLSTFMVEMVETAHILAHATPRSLVVFDEVGRGTSTYDGVSIAQAILEYLHEAPQLCCLTLFATHYHELTALSERLSRLRNHRMEVREEGERVVFLHQVVEGGADRSYGIHVAELAGLPRQVVIRARQVLSELEGQRPLERPPATAQLTLPLEHGLIQELKQLDLERLTPREALDKLFAWQVQHAAR